MVDTNERRTSPRARFTGAVIVRTTERELSCAGSNLSESGMLFYPPRELENETGEALQLTFTLPKLCRWLDIRATLVRQDLVHFQRPAWGVRFDHVSPTDRRVLRTFVVAGHGEVRDFEPEELDLDDDPGFDDDDSDDPDRRGAAPSTLN
jgi:c-di-GMP-binding flagellar brake protein YcgR